MISIPICVFVIIIIISAIPYTTVVVISICYSAYRKKKNKEKGRRIEEKYGTPKEN